jgi:PAP2 superfamily protein
MSRPGLTLRSPSHLHGDRQDKSSTASAYADVCAGRQLFQLNWCLLAVMMTVLDLALLLSQFRVRPVGYLVALAISAAYGIGGYYSASASPERPWISSMLTGIAQTILVMAVVVSMTYIAAAGNFPLQDERLLAFDRALGFDFQALVAFVNDRSWLIEVLAWGYQAISWPILTITILLPLCGHHLHAAEYVLVSLIALTVTTVISIFLPAIGAYGIIGLLPSDYPNFEPQGYYDTLRDLPLIRSGSLRVLDLPQLAGVVTFPSFHAAAAAIYVWALWPVRFVRWVNLLVNTAMLVATPIGGGHFLADVIAGVAVAGLSILAASRIARKVSGQRNSVSTNVLPAKETAFGSVAEPSR